MTVKPTTDPPEGAAATPPPAGAPPPSAAPAAGAPAAPPPAAPAGAPAGSGAAPAGGVQLDPSDIAAGVTASGDNGVLVPAAKFATIKRDAEARGKRKAEAEFLAPLFAAGFSSLEEALAAAATSTPGGSMSVPNPAGGAPAGSPAGAPGAGAPAGGQPAGAPAAGAAPAGAPAPGQPAPGAQPGQPGQPNPNERRYTPEVRAALQRQREQAAAQVQAAQAEAARYKAEAEQHQTSLATFQAEAQVGYKLAAAGCSDVEYALHKLRKHRESLKPEELAAFETAGAAGADGKPTPSPLDAWLAGLKTQSPALFTTAAPVQSSPAQTGTPSTPPPPPGPGQTATTIGDGARVDYRQLTPEKKREYDRANGLL